jgi:hypothetical protein
MGLSFSKNKWISFGQFKTQGLETGRLEEDLTDGVVTLKQNSSFILQDTTTGNSVQVNCEEFSQKTYTPALGGQSVSQDVYYYKISLPNNVQIVITPPESRPINSISDLKNFYKEKFASLSHYSQALEFKLDSSVLRIEEAGVMTKDSCFQGFYLYVDSQRVVARNTINNKNSVWFRNDIESRNKLLLAAVTCALVLAERSTVKGTF